MKKMLVPSLLVLGFLASVGVPQALAQTDTFMLVPNIRGSSTDSQHIGWINVISLAQTLVVPAAPSAAGAGGGPQPQCSMEVLKGLDISGPLLWGAAATFRRLDLVTIEVQTHNPERPVPLLIYQIKLHDAFVTAITTTGNGFFAERLTLSASIVDLKFLPNGPAGVVISRTFAC